MTSSVLVTGANGQLGMCLRKIENNYPNLKWLFLGHKELDITNGTNIREVFEKHRPDFVINTAAYTNVELAESETEKAFLINATGVKKLAEACKEFNTVLIHISTDYVFDGEKNTPYKKGDSPNPINQYGKSKLAGENFIQGILTQFYIIRTSWLYSEFGKNFYKTILNKAETDKEISVTDEQIGCPTNANNLALYILSLLKESPPFGLYHFCDGIAMTWYDFAKDILTQNNLITKVKLVRAKNYRTFAARPKNSVLFIEK